MKFLIFFSNAPEKEELVIPLLERDRETPMLAKAKQKKREREQQEENISQRKSSPARELTLDEQAERALLSGM